MNKQLIAIMNTNTVILEVYKLSSPSDIGLYNSFLNRIDANNPFYKIELLNVALKECHQLLYFIYTLENTPMVLMPFYLRKIVNFDSEKPYFDVISPYGYSGPLFSKKTDGKVLISFWKEVDHWYTNNQVVSEFIRFSLANNHVFYSGTLVHTLKNIRGTILEEDAQWNNFKYSVKKNYKNALKNDLKFKMYFKDIDQSKIEEFYSIYIATMKRNAANESFYHTIDYFINFIEKNKENCSLATIYKDNTAVSTELVLLSKDTMYSFLGGTNAAYFNLRPNDFLKIETLSWGRKQGFSYYVLGGGLVDDDNLYQYKKKFFLNDPDVIFYTGRKIVNNEIYQNLVNKINLDQISVNTEGTDISEGFFPKYRGIE